MNLLCCVYYGRWLGKFEVYGMIFRYDNGILNIQNIYNIVIAKEKIIVDVTQFHGKQIG